MKNQFILFLIGLTGCFLLSPVSSLAEDETVGLGIGVKAGTLGGGVVLCVGLPGNTRIRGGFNYFTFSFDSTLSDINYDFDIEFSSFSALFDWHPFGSSFYLSGGAYFNNNTIGVEGSVDEGVLPLQVPYAAALSNLVTISGDVEFQPVAPYAGIGWRSNSGERGWGVAFDLGVLFQGAPDVTNLKVNAPIDVNGVTEVKTFLAEQEEEIEDELSFFQFYPVASLMLTYHF